MAHELRSFTDLLAHIVDNRGKTCPTAPSGVPLIATNCVRNDLLYPAHENVRYVSKDTLETWFRGHPLPGDLIFVTKGSPGRVCFAPDPVDFCIAQDMVALRADETKIYPRYLFAVLRSPAIQERISQLHVGTLIPHFKKGDFGKLLIPVPAPALQREIGDIYFALSAKIELNRRMNETLEAIVRATFKSWFIDPAASEIPHGWSRGTIGDVAESPRRSAVVAAIDPSTPYVALEHMPRRNITLNAWTTAAKVESNKSIFRAGEILFGKLRPYFHKICIAPIDGVCSTDIVVIAPKIDEWYGFVLGHVSSDEIVRFVDGSSTGTKMPRTSWSDIARFEVALPPRERANAFSKLARPFFARIRSNIFESRTLASLRGTLLPKLLSGEIRVGAAENEVEEVV